MSESSKMASFSSWRRKIFRWPEGQKRSDKTGRVSTSLPLSITSFKPVNKSYQCFSIESTFQHIYSGLRRDLGMNWRWEKDWSRVNIKSTPIPSNKTTLLTHHRKATSTFAPVYVQSNKTRFICLINTIDVENQANNVHALLPINAKQASFSFFFSFQHFVWVFVLVNHMALVVRFGGGGGGDGIDGRGEVCESSIRTLTERSKNWLRPPFLTNILFLVSASSTNHHQPNAPKSSHRPCNMPT